MRQFLISTVRASVAAGVLATSTALFAGPLVKVGTFVPAKSVGVSKVIQPWMDAVQKDVGDAVTLKGFWGGTLGKSPFKQFELVKNGVADVTWVLPGYTGGQFPQMSIFELPFLFNNATEASRVGWKLHEKGLLKGLEDVHLIGFFASEPNAMFFSKPLASLADLDGKKIRSVGAIHAKWLESVGASAQTLSSSEFNEGLQRGTIDGAIQGWTGMRTFKSLPLVDQAIEVPVGVISFLLVMNKKTWDGLPPVAKTAVMKHGGLAMADTGGGAYSAIGKEIVASVAKEGRIKTLALDDATLKSYADNALAVHQWWIEKTPGGQQVYDEVQAMLKAMRK
ncbi:MAG: TRAP transporter substrate-binding protein [Burkholderiaceae bacterium]